MSTIIKVLPVKCGDAFFIKHTATDKKVRNILIDGGFINAYKALQKVIEHISKKKWVIDLWILTHLDADHINGAIQYLRDEEKTGKGKLLNKLWFNFFNGFKLNDDSAFLSFAKGFELTEILQKLRVKGRQDVTNELSPVTIGDAKIMLLSPDKATLTELKDRWKKEFKKYYLVDPPTYIVDPTGKDSKTIKELSKLKDAKEDWSKICLSNRSSIALLYEENGKGVLFMGDAYPSVIINSLMAKYSKKDPLKVKYVKLSHHGSRKNYSEDLLNIVKCRRFIISADGENQHGLPDKEVLAKILTHPNREKKKKIVFYFNHDDTRLRQLFDAEPDAQIKYNFRMKFPKAGKVLTVKF